MPFVELPHSPHVPGFGPSGSTTGLWAGGGHWSSCMVVVTIDRPDNGQDLPLPINFAQLPDFEA
jgi:hypothetical protein